MTTSSMLASGTPVRVSLADSIIEGTALYADTLGLGLSVNGSTVFYPWYSILAVTVTR